MVLSENVFEYFLFQKMMEELRIVKHKLSEGLHFTNEDLQVKLFR